MGTPEFAVPCLDILIKNFDVVGVFTQPDRPKGRGKKMAMSAVKERALADELPVFQPEKIRKSQELEDLKALKPDVIVVVAYGQLLSQEILDIPQDGCINVHASLLPKLRGAAPINWSIVNGDKVTGVSTQYMVKKLDAGDVIETLETEITENMTAGELHDILSNLGKDIILSTVKKIEAGTSVRTPQDDEAHTYAPKMDKDLSIIDFKKTAQEVHDLVRGFNPWPVAHTSISNGKLKVYRTLLTDIKSNGETGQITHVDKSGIFVNCSDYQLKLTEIQMPNKKRMTVEAFILGNSIEIGTKLGE
jgi:methionyl-tRNA formyltransferase